MRRRREKFRPSSGMCKYVIALVFTFPSSWYAHRKGMISIGFCFCQWVAKSKAENQVPEPGLWGLMFSGGLLNSMIKISQCGNPVHQDRVSLKGQTWSLVITITLKL
jgi:hypothetical protein